MAQEQLYPVYNPARAALVEAILARGRRADRLPVYRPEPEGVEPHPDGGAALPVYRNTQPQAYPVYNPERTPQGDERLTGDGGAELAARQTYPKYDPAAAQRLDDLLNTKATDKNGRLRSGAKLAALGPSRPTDSFGNMAGQALGRFITGAIFKNSDEELQRQHDIAQARPAAEREAAEEKRTLDAENTRSEIDYRNSQAEYNRQRPGLEALKQTQTALQREISNRLREPRAFDPSDAYDADLARRAQGAGVRFAPGAFGDYKNPFSLEVLDPSDPTGTHKTRFVYDRDSGSFQPLAANGQPVQTNYVQPVGADGMTAGTRGSLALGGRRADETQRHDLVTESQGGERIGIARKGLSLRQAAQDKSFSDTDRKAYGEAAKLLAESEQASNDADAYVANAMYKDKDTGQMVRSRNYDVKAAELQSKAESLRQQLYSKYGYLWQKEDGHLHMTSAEWRRNHPNVPLSVASRYDIIIDDDASMNPPTPQNRTVPRASAPSRSRSASTAAPSSGKTHVTRADARRLYPQLKNASDDAVDAAIRAGGYEPIP
jgi:hypothetical protein